MTAYWVVLAAVALTTLVAAVVGAALAAFAGQALPHAVRHELTAASGTSIAATAPVSGSGAAAQATATLKTAIGAALPGIPFTFWQASWSDPLGFAPGTLRARPTAVPAGSTLLLTAAAMQDVRERATLVAGQWPAAPAAPAAPGPAGAGQPIPAALPATAAALLHVSVGDVLRLRDRVSNVPVTFRITGLVTRRQLPATAAYWQLDPVPASGSVTVGGFTSFGPLLVNPAAFGTALPVGSATWAAQPDMTAFTDADLSQVAAGVSALQSSVASSAESGDAQLSGVQLTTGLAGVLSGTAENLTVARSLLAISTVQLLVLAVAALLAIARLLAGQRATETELLTARGATRWQLTRLTATEVIPLCCVAALLGAFAGIRLAQLLAGTIYRGAEGAADAAGTSGISAAVGLAVLVVPGSRLGPGVAPAGTWWPPAAAALVAICAPAVIAVWQHRLPRRRAQRRRRPRPATRLVAEATACLAAIAGVLVFRQQGTQAGTGVNLYTSAAPALIAIPAVIVVLRVYPLVLRGLLRGSARSPGATAFLGLARAARTVLTPALPAFALVLALSVTAFAGMVRDAVGRGETAASWQAVGADATIMASTLRTPGVQIYPAAVRAATAVNGVTHAAAVWQASWSTQNNDQLTGLVVDPASYAALAAATQGFPQLPGSSRLLSPGRAGTPVPVLASPQAAAYLGHGVSTLTSDGPVQPVPVRVVGVVPATQALPGVPAFVIIPRSALHSFAAPRAPVPVNELLLTGAGIDRARLAAVVRDMIPEGGVTFRSDVLDSLTIAPLQHGTNALFELAVVVAAGLGLAVMLLELALGAAEREVTLARLATMGLDEGHRARMVVLEVLPAVIAAAIAAWACAVVLPRVVAPAIDLSAFTGSSAGVALTPDLVAVAPPLAGLAVLAAVALAIEIRTGRRRGVAASLRAGG